MTPDTSGPEYSEPLAIYDPASSSWRMSGGMFPSDSMPSLATFPASGMTRDGRLFELPMRVPVMGEPASSSLPTPTCSEATGPGYTDRVNGGGKNLRTEVANLPTPTAQQGRNLTSGRAPGSEHHSGTSLNDWLWIQTGRLSASTPTQYNDMNKP